MRRPPPDRDDWTAELQAAARSGALPKVLPELDTESPFQNPHFGSSVAAGHRSAYREGCLQKRSESLRNRLRCARLSGNREILRGCEFLAGGGDGRAGFQTENRNGNRNKRCFH